MSETLASEDRCNARERPWRPPRVWVRPRSARGVSTEHLPNESACSTEALGRGGVKPYSVLIHQGLAMAESVVQQTGGSLSTWVL